MKLIDRFSIFRAMWPARPGAEWKAEQKAAKAVAAETARRWSAASTRAPELAGDLIRLGGILALYPARFEDGAEVPEPMDPIRMAYDRGRREMAVQLLALMGTTNEQLTILMEVDE